MKKLLSMVATTANCKNKDDMIIVDISLFLSRNITTYIDIR